MMEILLHPRKATLEAWLPRQHGTLRIDGLFNYMYKLSPSYLKIL